MARTLIDYIDQVEHAIGSSTDVRVDPTQTVNDAGEYLVQMHNWSWLEPPPVDLDFVADQAYVDLPTGVDQVLYVEAKNRIETSVHLTTIDEILYLRSSTLVDPFTYHVAVVFPEQASTTTIAPKPRLEIWPTPGASETDALTLRYRRGWVVLSAMNAVPNMPLDMESLLVQLVRAYALGYVDEQRGKGSVPQRLETIERSAMLNRLKSKYGMSQRSMGLMQGGILQTGSDYIYRPHRTLYAGGQSPP